MLGDSRLERAGVLGVLSSWNPSFRGLSTLLGVGVKLTVRAFGFLGSVGKNGLLPVTWVVWVVVAVELQELSQTPRQISTLHVM